MVRPMPIRASTHAALAQCSRIATAEYRRAETAVAMADPLRSVLLLEGARDGEVQLVADQRHVGLHPELGALERAGGLEADRDLLAQRVHAGADQGDVERHRLGHAVEREVARHLR